MTHLDVTPATGPLSGTVRVPGDKSLSHRAVLFASMAEGTSRLTGVLASEDVRATISACINLGATIKLAEKNDGTFGEIVVTGWGAKGPQEPEIPLYCGNSGTTVRLLMGVLAGWPVTVCLTGDASLSGRPMRRVTDPLTMMGASFVMANSGTLPLTLRGCEALDPIDYASPVASAQVKSAILLAGLRAQGTTRVTEPALSRDHTERLLPAFGVPVAVDDAPSASVTGPALLSASDVVVPADPSSAAFPVAAALLVPGSEVTLPDVSLNPTRVGFLRVLERMGAAVSTSDHRGEGAETLGTILARAAAPLSATVVTADEVPALVDEVPILALVATAATGTTRFQGVGELRVKESDRLTAIADGLSSLGATVRTGDDWLEVDGPTQLHAAVLDSVGDHRLAMTWAVAGLVAEGGVHIDRWDAVAVSYPRFEDDIAALLAQ